MNIQRMVPVPETAPGVSAILLRPSVIRARLLALLLLPVLGLVPMAAADLQAQAPAGSAVDDRPVVAVMDFNGTMIGEAGNSPYIGKAVTAMLITELSGREGIRVIERAQLQNLLNEQRLALSGRVDELSAGEIGRMLNAQYVIEGGVISDGRDFRIDMRAVDVETSAIPESRRLRGDAAGLLDLVVEIAELFAGQLNLPRTSARPSAAPIPVRATIEFSRAINFEDTGDRASAIEHYRRTLEIHPDHAQARAALDRLEGRSQAAPAGGGRLPAGGAQAEAAGGAAGAGVGAAGAATRAGTGAATAAQPAQPARTAPVTFDTDLPRTLVFIAEAGDGQVAAGDFTDFLREAGFPLIDPALAHSSAQRELVQRALAGDEGAATELGRDFGAQLLVIGRADWGARPDPLDQSAITATSEVSIRALRLDRGDVVATGRADARTLEATEQAARTRSIRSATRQILQGSGFMGQVLNDWSREPWQDALYWRPDPGSVPAETSASTGGAAGGAATAGGAAAVAAAGDGGRRGPGIAILRADVAPSTQGTTRGLGVVKRGSRDSSVFNPVHLEGVVVGETRGVEVEGRPATLSPLREGEARQLGLEGMIAQRFHAETSLPLSQDTVRVTATGRDGGISHALAAPRVNNRYAVIIGIGDYRASDIPNLEFARADAEAMYDFLTSEAAGPFEPQNILFLADEEATGAAMREAMFVFLQQAQWDDLVVIYYAGHGAPDPNRPGNLYLLPHDSDLNAMASTGFPMWDVKTALRRQIAAERVIVIADACHSAGTGADDFDGAGNAIAGGFSELFAPSRRLTITAAAANEYSLEDARWGGHGVFTHYLLDALRGAGDLNGDGIVTFNEAYEYVTGKVVSATNGRQNPQRSGWGDIPLAVVSADR